MTMTAESDIQKMTTMLMYASQPRGILATTPLLFHLLPMPAMYPAARERLILEIENPSLPKRETREPLEI